MRNHTPLTGQYITLEPLEEIHRESLRAISRDEKISAYSPALRLKFDSWFDKALKKYPDANQLSYVVRLLSNQELVGSTRFYEMSPEHQRVTIGYTWFVPQVWGSVVNKECKLLLLQYAFDTLRMNRVEFCVDARNARSRAALKKLGATEEGILRQHIVLDDGFVRDTVVYSILKTEWPGICSNLRRVLYKD